jgi:hypothetical protein
MLRSFGIMALSLGLALGYASSVWAEEEQKLTSEQQQILDDFQKTLESPPVKPNEKEAHLKSVQGYLGNFLGAKEGGMRRASNTLAGTLVQGVNGRLIGVSTSVALSKEILKVLSLPSISYEDTNRFIKTIDPLVQGTDLRGTEKMGLYGDAVNIIRSSPKYTPPGR